MTKRARVTGRNGAWDFAFTKDVKHGKGKRTVEVGVPVIQVLELADQFRRCAGSTPGHAVYHLERLGTEPTCLVASRGRANYYGCSACGCVARSIDLDTRTRCVTCGKEGSLEQIPDEEVDAAFARAALTKGELAVELEQALRKIRFLDREVERLAGWLRKIDGGDDPCTDEGKLRQWAYEAIALNREPEEATA